MKIRRVGAEFFHEDGHTDTQIDRHDTQMDRHDEAQQSLFEIL
jgi:hypothetical protein